MEVSNLELAILGLLAEAPKHGYQIERDIQDRGMREWAEIGFSSIYHILNKLEKIDWLRVRFDHSGRGPSRKVYSLTKTGLDGYRAAVLARLAAPRRYSSDFELALANLPALPPDQIRTALETYSDGLKTKIIELTNKLEENRKHGLPPHAERLFDHSLHALKSELNWIQTFTSNFEKDCYDDQPDRS